MFSRVVHIRVLMSTDHSIHHEKMSFLSARFGVIGELLVNFGHSANHKCMEMENLLALFTSNTTECYRVMYTKQKLWLYIFVL